MACIQSTIKHGATSLQVPRSLRTALVAILLVGCYPRASAQEGEGEGDLFTQYFNLLVEQYKNQTGDSIVGEIRSDDFETQASIKFDAEKYTEAIPYFDKLVRRHPTAWNFFRRGYCHWSSNSHQAAIEDMTRSISRFPDPLPIYWVGTRVAMHPESKVYEKVFTITPQHRYVDAFFLRAAAKLQLGDYYGCIADIDSYFTKLDECSGPPSPMDNRAFTLSGFSKLQINDLQGAVSDLTAATFGNPEDGEAYYFLGVAHIESGETAEGCRALSRAGELGFRGAYDLIKTNCSGGR